MPLSGKNADHKPGGPRYPADENEPTICKKLGQL